MFFFVLSSWISFGSNNVDIYIVSYLYHTDIILRALWMKRMFMMRYSVDTTNRWEDKGGLAVHILANILHNYKCVGMLGRHKSDRNFSLSLKEWKTHCLRLIISSINEFFAWRYLLILTFYNSYIHLNRQRRCPWKHPVQPSKLRPL